MVPTSTKIQTTGSTAHTKLDFVKKSKICLTLLITPADAKVMTSCRSADALVNVEPGQVSARENWESMQRLLSKTKEMEMQESAGASCKTAQRCTLPLGC